MVQEKSNQLIGNFQVVCLDTGVADSTLIFAGREDPRYLRTAFSSKQFLLINAGISACFALKQLRLDTARYSMEGKKLSGGANIMRGEITLYSRAVKE
jgi:hypothetical protein